MVMKEDSRITERVLSPNCPLMPGVRARHLNNFPKSDVISWYKLCLSLNLFYGYTQRLEGQCFPYDIIKHIL